jgi:hypothetical protein
MKELKKQKGNDTTFSFGSNYPIFIDKDSEGGTMKGDYFHLHKGLKVQFQPSVYINNARMK